MNRWKTQWTDPSATRNQKGIRHPDSLLSLYSARWSFPSVCCCISPGLFIPVCFCISPGTEYRFVFVFRPAGSAGLTLYSARRKHRRFVFVYRLITALMISLSLYFNRIFQPDVSFSRYEYSTLKMNVNRKFKIFLK